MMRILSFGGSAGLHAGALGLVLWAGTAGLRREPPRASVAPSTPVSFDVRRDDPAPVAFDLPSLPESLPLADAELEYEAERVEAEIDVLPAVSFSPERPAPSFERPSRVTIRVVAAAAPEPTPDVEAEQAAVEIYNPPPAYPAAARRRSQEGHALVELRILKDGSVADPVVLECAGSPLFADAALKAVSSWRYQPATLGGVPVDRVHRVRFTFKIQ
jgi:protein TonB